MLKGIGNEEFSQEQTLQAHAGKNSDTFLKDKDESVPPTNNGGDAGVREFWQSSYSEELPDFEIREINANIANFFGIVAELGREHELSPDDENEASTAVNPCGTSRLSRQSRKPYPAAAFPKIATKLHKKSSSNSEVESPVTFPKQALND